MTNVSNDNDPVETQEWLDALASLVEAEGRDRAQFVLDRGLEAAAKHGIESGAAYITTACCNAISLENQPEYPGDLKLESTLEAYIRWNAIAMVLAAKKSAGGVGGHLS